MQDIVINGRYLLHEKLGQGGMGIVHRATDRLTGDVVALKQVFLPVEQLLFTSRPASQTNRELRLALAHEFQTLASMRHPHIISVLDYGFDEEKRPFFTMSYLENAQTILEAGNGRSAAEKIDLLLQTLEALAYLHRRGILHRDIKPENVLVVADPQNGEARARVLDFGLASAKEQAIESVGSWLYMAPEVFQGKAATEASDLYALGVLAFRMFAGEHPFDPYADDVQYEILYGVPDWSQLDETAVPLLPILQKLLAKQPEERLPTASAVIAALNNALGQPTPPETTAVQESYLQAATFIGRTIELAKLTTALQTAVSGQGSVWFIGGESGVGKSRLLHELRTQALVDGFLVLQGQAVREEGGLPYQLWRNLLRLLLLKTPTLDPLLASVLQPLVPDIAQLLGRAVVPAPELASNTYQQRLYDAIAQLIALQKQPVLLLLEDLQWTEVSLLPLSAVTRHIEQQSLVVVGTYRDDEPHDAVRQLVIDLPYSQHISLARLSAAEMVALSQAMLGTAGQSEQVLTLLQRETEGNAFFAVEVVRALAQEAGRLGNIGLQGLPKQVFTNRMAQILRRRLQRVAAPDQFLLQLAAVAGRQPDMGLLAELHAPRPLDDWLTAVHESAVFVVENGRWQFAHDKLRDAILNDISPAEITKQHAAIATTLEQLYPDAPDRAASLAHHWRYANQPQREQPYRYQAAQLASQQYAYPDALRHLERALALATTPDALYEALVLRERLYELLGNEAARTADLERLVVLAPQVTEPSAQAFVARRQAERAERQGEYALCIVYAEQAIAVAQQIDHQAGIADGHVLWGSGLTRLGDYEAAAEKMGLALHLYQQVGNHNGAGKALIGLGMVAFYQALHKQAEQHFQAALEHYKTADFLVGIVRSYNSLGVSTYTRGLYDQAQRHYENGLQVARQLGSQREQTPLLNNLGVVTYILGLYDQSQRYYETALLQAREVQERSSEVLALANLGRLFFTQGRLEQAVPYLHEAYDLAREVQDRWAEASALNNLGHIYDLLQDYEQAEVYFERVRTVEQFASQPPQLIKATLGLLHIGIQQGGEVSDLLAQLFAFLAQDREIKGSAHVMELYLLFYRCLGQLGDGRQTAVLTQAYDLLQERAARLQDEAQRRSFLENVPEHQEIVRLYREL